MGSRLECGTRADFRVLFPPVIERSMSSRPARESSGAFLRSGSQRNHAVIELVPKRGGQAQVELLVGRHPIFTHADLRKGGDLTREFLSLLSRGAYRHDAIDQSHLQSFARVNR